MSKSFLCFLKKIRFFAFLCLSQTLLGQSEKPYPTFSGGETALMQYLHSQIQYPTSSVLKEESGRVHVTFIIDFDGSVTEVLVWEGVSIAINEEAARVVRGMPRWNLGYVGKKRVRAKYSIWLDFKLPSNFSAKREGR